MILVFLVFFCCLLAFVCVYFGLLKKDTGFSCIVFCVFAFGLVYLGLFKNDTEYADSVM